MFFKCCKTELDLPINPEIGRGVLQGEAGITSFKAKQHIVGSIGAGPCVIISMYNPSNKTAGVAHIDTVAKPAQAMDLLKYQITNGEYVSDCQLEVELATSFEHLDLGATTLDDIKSIIIKRNDFILKNIHDSSSLAIDAKTGKTFVNLDSKALDHGENLDRRMEERGISAQFSFGRCVPIEFVFDGRNQLAQVNNDNSSTCLLS